MTNFIQMFSRNLKIAAILAIVCVCAQPAIGQQTPAAPPAKEARDISPAKDLQTPSTQREIKEIKIFQLLHSDAETMAGILDKILSGKEGVRITIDKQKNALILMGSMEQMQVVKAILEKLDSPSPSEKNRSLPVNVRIRVFWLIDGNENDAAPAECLKDVVEELHRQGLKNIRQVAQMMVLSQYEGTFQISCSPIADNKSVILSASGRILAESKLQISIFANEIASADKPGKNLANVSVNTVFKTNDYVVLAVAPIGKITSVFVIQITDSNP